MTIRTRIHGYTSWINVRLLPFERSLNNILMDLLRGTNMKIILESFTGEKNEKFQSFENMTKEQIQTRIKWFLKELKENNVIAQDIELDTRLVAIRSAKHIFELLWRLLCHDIFFLWERIDFLTSPNEEILVKAPFRWVPVSIAKPKKKLKGEISQLSGFTSLPFVQDMLYGEKPAQLQDGLDDEPPNPTDTRSNEQIKIAKFPGYEMMKSFSIRGLSTGKAPEPRACIIEMINIQLKTVPEGRKINFTSLNEISDTRILCSFVNSFIPNLFPTEILMNDKWCLNLVLRTIDKILMVNSTMDSEDLVEADYQCICAYFCYLLMMFYKFRQCKAVLSKYKNTEINIRKMKKKIQSVDDRTLKLSLENKLLVLTMDLENLKTDYDIKHYIKWMENVQIIKNTVHHTIQSKFKLKFDWFPLSEDITVANLCYNQAVNLSLTNGVAFYKITSKELITLDRKMIIVQKDAGGGGGKNLKFFYDFEKPAKIFRQVLRLTQLDPAEVDPKRYPHLDIFVQCLSNNKVLKKGTVFFYQVFPSTLMFYHKFLIKACKEKDYDAVVHLVEFFKTSYPNFVNMREPGTLNTALHVAASNGYFAIMLYLLESNASVQIRNYSGNTPLVMAALALHRDCAKLLLEFGADLSMKNPQTGRESIVTDMISTDFRLFLNANIQRLSDITPGCTFGNYNMLSQVITDHAENKFPLCTLRSRFINGSTLLHQCASYGYIDLVERLLGMTDLDEKLLNPNTRDHRGCTPLHHCKHMNIARVLIEYGADVNVVDLDGNMPLHLKCLGETGQPSQLDIIELLLYFRAELRYKNKEKMLPIHMAAIQGRIDVIELLLKKDSDSSFLLGLNKDTSSCPYSFSYIALINDQLNCASWLIKKGFELRDGEGNKILYKVLTEEAKIQDIPTLIGFLAGQGCHMNKKYERGNTLLHLAAAMSGEHNDVIQALLDHGINVNALNDEGKSALFAAVENNNPITAACLLRNNADYNIMCKQGTAAFDLIKDIEDWARSEFFEPRFLEVIRSYEHKQIRKLIRTVSSKVKIDQSATASLLDRSQTIEKYLQSHLLQFNGARKLITLNPPSHK